ncbi:MAG: hypothetical protein AABP62_07040 [Planctomycetota bacterium]
MAGEQRRATEASTWCGPPPIDTAENIQVAYQFNRSLSVFWYDAPFSTDWLPALQQVT